MGALNLDEAVAVAIELKKSSGNSVDPVYLTLEKAIHDFESDGFPLESIIPQGEDARLGFSLKRADGKSFSQIYLGMIRDRLCSDGGEFQKLIKSGLSSSVSAILTVIVSSLGIPLAALGIMIPIAVIISNTGLDAFCEFTKQE
jgi:hypothetical protein